MPDLLGHVAFARIVREVAPVRRAGGTGGGPASPGMVACYYLGALLPDLATRPFHILMPTLSPFVEVFHSPACLVLLGIAWAGLFVPELRRRALVSVLSGIATHMVIDLVQRHLAGGYLLYFPLSFHRNSLGLLWPEETTTMLTPWLVLAAVAAAGGRRRRGGPGEPWL
jgi:hypothetical protein